MVSVLAFTRGAVALDPSRQITQYGHTAWRLADGAFAGAPHAMTQTADGYLWIGTDAGLVRFDGVQFVPWQAPDGTGLPANGIQSLLGARDGSLWIGTTAGLARWSHQKLVSYPITAGRINGIVEDSDGAIWIVRSRPQNAKGPLCRVVGDAAQCFNQDQGLVFPYAETLVDDRLGGLWIGTTIGVCHWKSGSVDHHYFPERLKHADGSNGVEGLLMESDGSLLVGIGQAGRGLGLQMLDAGAWKDYPMATTAVATLLMDRDKGLWISTKDAGLLHLRTGQTDSFRQTDGLSSDSVENFFEDREGNVWTISPRGIDRFRDLPVGSFSKLEGLAADVVNSVFASSKGTVWVGNRRALVSLRPDASSRIIEGNQLPGKSVTSLLEDSAGRLWIGIDGELYILENGRFRRLKRRDSSPIGMVIGIVEETDASVWALAIGKPQRLFRFRNYQIEEELAVADPVPGNALVADPQGGIWLGHQNGKLDRYRSGRFDRQFSATAGAGVTKSLLVDPDGGTWATSTKGLVSWKNGRYRILNKRNGLPCEDLFSAIRDARGSLWLSGTCGVMAISAGELDRWRTNPSSTVHVRHFDVFDGAQPGATPFSPSVTRASDGRLWFSTGSVLQFIDPDHLPKNHLPPPVRIEAIVADGKAYPNQENLRLPAMTRNIEVDYTALSFAVPQKVWFRYKLDAWDAQWQEVQTRRQAFYTDLGPGQYRFRLAARDKGGVWNEEEAVLSFSIAPAYYQTAWFRLTLAGATALLLWAGYRLRVQQVAASMKARFDERLAERNRLSSELQDAVLQTVQASRMIAELALQNEGGDMRKTVETLAIWLAKASSEGQAALNSLEESLTNRNDLAAALRRAAESLCHQSAMELELSVQGEPKDMHPIVRDDILRIGSQAIQNACAHSKGTRLEIALYYGQDFGLHVRDNGQGFDPDTVVPENSGIVEMRDIAQRIRARLRILSSVTSGTEVELIVPGQVAFSVSPQSDTLKRLWNSLRGPT